MTAKIEFFLPEKQKFNALDFFNQHLLSTIENTPDWTETVNF